MALVILSTFLMLVMLGTNTADASGLSKRFFFDDLIPPQLKREECILCKCYQECHAGDYHFSESDVCRDFLNSIKCSEVDRCSCCNDLILYHPCQYRGECKNIGHGNFTCHCISGWYGHRCDNAGFPQLVQQTDFCASNPCLNGATCTNETSGYSCKCAIGWAGQNCETDIDECALNNPCRNSAVCTNIQGHYSCGCTSGWSGPQCQIDINECVTSPCNNGGTCFNTQGSYRCVCGGGLGRQNCDIGTLPACSHTCTLGTVVKSQPVESNGTDTCPGTSNRATNEALLIQCCNLGRSDTWHKGVQVMQHCKDSTIPPYTPIAAVVNGKLIQDTAGVFTACLDNGSGFKIILQKCNTDPKLIKVNGTDGNNPVNYFVMY